MGIRQAFGDMRFMKTLFTSAEKEAHALGDELPGPEHLLLAALQMSDDSGRRALERVGAGPDQVRESIGRVHSTALSGLGIHTDDGRVGAADDGEVGGPDGEQASVTGPYRSTGAAQEVFQRVIAHSKSQSPSTLRTAHVVLAVAEQQRGTAARVLAALDIDPQQLAVAARESTDAR